MGVKDLPEKNQSLSEKTLSEEGKKKKKKNHEKFFLGSNLCPCILVSCLRLRLLRSTSLC
jgi:hypothetical protein